jgi:hypothetical protein
MAAVEVGILPSETGVNNSGCGSNASVRLGGNLFSAGLEIPGSMAGKDARRHRPLFSLFDACADGEEGEMG